MSRWVGGGGFRHLKSEMWGTWIRGGVKWGKLRVVLSHPFAENAKGWGNGLWLGQRFQVLVRL
jgi:hypothetical protein